MATNIFRPQTDAEKDLKSGGFKDISTWRDTDVLDIERKKIAELSHEFIHKKRVPFCIPCAINAVKNRLSEIQLEIRRMKNKGETKIDVSLNINYADYAGEKRFGLVNDTEEIIETVRIAGIKETTITGEYKNYICKECGGCHSIQFDNRELIKDKNFKSEPTSPQVPPQPPATTETTEGTLTTEGTNPPKDE